MLVDCYFDVICSCGFCSIFTWFLTGFLSELSLSTFAIPERFWFLDLEVMTICWSNRSLGGVVMGLSTSLGIFINEFVLFWIFTDYWVPLTSLNISLLKSLTEIFWPVVDMFWWLPIVERGDSTTEIIEGTGDFLVVLLALKNVLRGVYDLYVDWTEMLVRFSIESSVFTPLVAWISLSIRIFDFDTLFTMLDLFKGDYEFRPEAILSICGDEVSLHISLGDF